MTYPTSKPPSPDEQLRTLAQQVNRSQEGRYRMTQPVQPIPHRTATPNTAPPSGAGGVIASGAYSVPTLADTFDGFYLVLQDGPFNEVGSIEDYITLGGDGSIQVLQASWFQVQANLAVGLGGSFASKAVYGGCDLPQLTGYSLNNGIHGSATTDSGGVAKWTTTSLPFYCNPGYDATIRAWAAGNDSLLSAGQNVYGNVFVAVMSGSAP